MQPERRVLVVAAVVRRDGRYLLGLRPAEKRHGGLWEYPGGKVRDGESRAEAIRRELDEELALEVSSVGEVVFSARDVGSRYLIEFIRTTAEGSPVAREHQEVGWFTPAEMERLPLAPADAAFARALGTT